MKIFIKHLKHYVKRTFVGVGFMPARSNRVSAMHGWVGTRPTARKAVNAREYKFIIKQQAIEWVCIRDCFTEASNDEYYL